MINDMPERYLTTAEACTQLRCHRATIHRLVAAGRLTPIRLGARKNLYRQADIDTFLEQAADDQAAIINAALAFMAERQAEEHRPLCSECGKRRVTRGQSFCTWCIQQRDADLLKKATWWQRNGQEWRDQRRRENTGA